MKVLVTGASGFIGSNLVERLLKEGNEVIGIDNDKKKSYLLNEINSKKFSMIWDDINNIESHNDLKNFDIVYHLAASADIRKSYTDPMLDLKNNVLGTNKILEFIRRSNVTKLVFSSSSSIYGITSVVPTPENVGNIRPISMYGASKLANEAFISSYCDLYGIKAWMFRFANVVGRHQHRGVIVDFYKKLKENNRELEILGDGNQRKSYFDVGDCVSGLIDIPNIDSKKSCEAYNLGNTKTITVTELATIVCNELSVAPSIRFSGGDRGWPGDTPYTILSTKKANDLGWIPKYTPEQSIKRTIEYLKEAKQI
jgi:UDP-glucose 4-epimerase